MPAKKRKPMGTSMLDVSKLPDKRPMEPGPEEVGGKAKSFIAGGAGVAAPEKPKELPASPKVDRLQPYSTKLRESLLAQLMQETVARKIAKKPYTTQIEIIEQALTEWLAKNRSI